MTLSSLWNSKEVSMAGVEIREMKEQTAKGLEGHDKEFEFYLNVIGNH